MREIDMSLQKGTPNGKNGKSARASVTLIGYVDRILPPVHPALPERAQIVIEEADHMYREIRVENRLDGVKGKPCRLKVGEEVDVRIEADLKWTVSNDELN